MIRFFADRAVLLIVALSLSAAGIVLALAAPPSPGPGDGPTIRGVREAGTPFLGSTGSFADFGARDVSAGPSIPPQKVTLYNSGGGPLVINELALGGSDPTAFRHRTSRPVDCTVGMTLTSGEGCKVRIGFNPGLPGAKSAVMNVNTTGGSRSFSLSGRGTVPMTISARQLDFGSQAIEGGPTPVQFATVQNKGSVRVTFRDIVRSGDRDVFSRRTGEPGDCKKVTTLYPDETCKVRVRFDPGSSGLTGLEVLLLSKGFPAALRLNVNGTGVDTQLASSSPSLAFGDRGVDDGPTEAQSTTITNDGQETVTFAGVGVAGADPDAFELLPGGTETCADTTTLAVGDECTATVRFDPSSTGSKSATLVVDSDAPDLVVALTGTGIETGLALSPEAIAFGSIGVDAGPTPEQAATLTNLGPDTATISALSIGDADASQFALLGGAAGDCAVGTELEVDEDCTVRMRFDPSTVGDKAATLSASTDSFPELGTLEASAALAGTGTAATPTPGDDVSPAKEDPAPAPAPPDPPRPPVVGPWQLTRVGDADVVRGRRGRITVTTGHEARCPAGGPTCTGRLTLKLLRPSRRTGRLLRIFLTGRKVAPITLAPGTSAALSFRLGADGRRLLRRLGSFQGVLRGSVRSGGARPVVREALLRLAWPR